MSRRAYVNGRFVRQMEATVSIEDRGFQLSDGVYEVWAVFGGRLADADGHFARLGAQPRRAAHTHAHGPGGRSWWCCMKPSAATGCGEGTVYLQVTRGVARRDHAFPDQPIAPTLVITARRGDPQAAEARAAVGVSVITLPDIRWGRCDIKSIGLLPNVLAKQAAREQGAFEAWLVDAQGLVTEGAASNAWIVAAEGVLRTRETKANILRGVTRLSLFDLAAQIGLKIEQRPFTVAEAKTAREAFLTGAGALVMPMVRIDGQQK